MSKSNPPTTRLPARPSLEQLRNQASDLLRAHRAGDPDARTRIPKDNPTLADAQFAIAREHGFETWAKLKHQIQPSQKEQYELLATDLQAACHGDQNALTRLHRIHGNDFMQASVPFDLARLREKIDQRLSKISKNPTPASTLSLADAQLLVARQHGISTWPQLIAEEETPLFSVHTKTNEIVPGPVLSPKTWDIIFGVIEDRGITALNAAGRMTDAAMKRLSKLHRVTRLNLGGSLQLTDSGLLHLKRMPQLRELQIDGWKGQLTDAALAATLPHLRELRTFNACWQQNISDAGFAHLASCEQLVDVNLLGTHAGDQTLAALAHKPHLRQLQTGRAVTDAGIDHLHNIPAFKTWLNEEIKYGLMGAGAWPTRLTLDGPFTDRGLAQLQGLDGLFGLGFFWHSPAFTSAGLAHLAALPHLGSLSCGDAHCDDEALHHIGSLPHLRMLLAQGATASDKGFEALSHSQTLEYLWGRDWSNFTSKGFAALAQMPALRGLAVNLKNIELTELPNFPALRELTPMNVPDEAFRHIAKCPNLEALWCMYCRDTGDAATAHIERLQNLKTYYAGASQITDLTLEILSSMPSLERLEFWQCLALTDKGIAHLANLPNLRTLTLGGLPNVTREIIGKFPPQIELTLS
jgi:hypothetical protein